MARQFHVNGEAMIYVRFGAHVTSIPNAEPVAPHTYQLGLPQDGVTLKVIPEEKTAFLYFDLVHYDVNVLNACIAEGMGAYSFESQAMSLAGNKHPVCLHISSPIDGQPHTFPYAYFDGQFECTLGMKRSAPKCTVRIEPTREPEFVLYHNRPAVKPRRDDDFVL